MDKSREQVPWPLQRLLLVLAGSIENAHEDIKVEKEIPNESRDHQVLANDANEAFENFNVEKKIPIKSRDHQVLANNQRPEWNQGSVMGSPHV